MIKSAAVSFAALLLASGVALAQPAGGPSAADAPKAGAPKTEAPKSGTLKPSAFEPYVGQPGKDVVWVPTPQETVDRMLEVAGAKPGDYLIDLGAGDGRTVITAAKRGIRAFGIEFNPDMVELARRNAASEHAGPNARFMRGDIFKTNFNRATVLTMYLLPELNLKLRPTILKMRPGTRVVSHSFDMGDWTPDQAVTRRGETCDHHRCEVYFWVVPARVNGTWNTGVGRLSLTQKFQTFTGTLTNGGETLKIEDGRLRGAEMTFTAGSRTYSGTVKGKRIDLKLVSVKT